MSGLPEPCRFPLLPPSGGRFASLRAARSSNRKLLEWNELLRIIVADPELRLDELQSVQNEVANLLRAGAHH